MSEWFGEGNTVDILHDMTDPDYRQKLKEVPGLKDLVEQFQKGKDEATRFFLMEFCLHGLAEHSLISRNRLAAGLQFKDLLSSMFSPDFGLDDDEDDDEDFRPRRR
ncbi:hypothetical protein BH24BAC1_BH24BAC1_27260 [soil metagenome]